MIYDFYSRNSDLSFTIEDNEERIERFWDWLECSVGHFLSSKVRNMKSRLKNNEVVRVDKLITKSMSEKVEHDLNSKEMFDHMKDIFINCNYDINFRTMTYLTQFQKFIKRTRGGFVIHRRER